MRMRSNHMQPLGPSDVGKNSTEDRTQLQTGTDDEWTDIDIAARKEAFLSSQCSFSQDFMAMNDDTEISACVKCNNGGQLLVCNSNACQIRIHESCMSSAPTLDENGNFSCPFCVYSRAISVYQEAKRRAFLAKNRLQAFLSSQVKLGQQKACVRNVENPMVAEPSRLRVPNESLCGDEEVSLDDPRSTEAGDMEEKGNEAPSSPITDSRDHPVRRPRICKRKFTEKESHVSGLSSHSRRFIKQKPQYTSPRIPKIGRNKLPWTKLEEEILKEGVERFCSGHEKGIPWKDILKFGEDVFDKRRTSIDLKDKWRNMKKKISQQ